MTNPAHAPDRCESCTGSLDREPSDPSPAHNRCRACVEADRSRAMVGRGPTAGPSAALSPPRATVGRTLPALFRDPAEGAAASPAASPGASARTRVLPPLAPLSGGLAVVLVVLLSGVGVTACNPIRNAAMTTVAGPPDGCAPRTYRCHTGAPEVCSASRRWWPTLPRDPTGVPRVCTGSCRIDPRDNVAFCSPLPPDADPSEDAPVSLPPPSPPPAAALSAPPTQHGAHGAM